MATAALVNLVNTLVDAGVDTVKALSPGESLSQRISQYENLINDAVVDVSSIGDVASEAKSLTFSDGLSLVAAAITRCGFSSGKAQSVVASVLKFISDLGNAQIVPDLLAVIAAIKG